MTEAVVVADPGSLLGSTSRLRRRVLEEADTWEPACVSGDELDGWREANRRAASGNARRPCEDCPLSFAIEQRAQGTCNGEPSGVDDDDPEDERFLTTKVGPDARLLRLLSGYTPTRIESQGSGRIGRHDQETPFAHDWVPDVSVEPMPQPDPSVPVDVGVLLDHVRGVGFATTTPPEPHQEEDTMPTEPEPGRDSKGRPLAGGGNPTEGQRRKWEAYHVHGGQSLAAKVLGCDQGSVRSGLLGYMRAMGIEGTIPEAGYAGWQGAPPASTEQVPATPDPVVPEHGTEDSAPDDAPSVAPQSSDQQVGDVDPMHEWDGLADVAERAATDVTPPARSDDPTPETQLPTDDWSKGYAEGYRASVATVDEGREDSAYERGFAMGTLTTCLKEIRHQASPNTTIDRLVSIAQTALGDL